MRKLLDKHGREIMPGDVLKVFHFIGKRNKKHYMYKIAFMLDGFMKRLTHTIFINKAFRIKILMT